MTNITKEQFDTAYNKHIPNAWIKFAFKYFSKSTEAKDIIVRFNVIWILCSLFVVGLLATILNLPVLGILIITLCYAAILVAMAILLFGAAIMNNLRLNKIRKELNVNKVEYEELVDKFYS